jgi:hypothetical protein
MSTVTSSANRYWTFQRQTAYLVDPQAAVPSTSLVSRQPRIPSWLQVNVGGTLTTSANFVTMSGTDRDGTAKVSTFAITAVSNNSDLTGEYSTITSIDLGTGWSGTPTISVTANSGDGTPNLIRYDVAASRPVAFSPQGKPSWPALTQGTHEIDATKALIDYEEAWTPRVGDLATDDQTLNVWEVLGVREVFVGFGLRPHHYELRCSRHKT